MLVKKKIACMVLDVKSDTIRFIYPTEEVINSINKNTVQKIVYLSGEIQMFSVPPAYKQVIGPDDWENVSITRSAKEVRSFRQVGSVSAQARGFAGTAVLGGITGAILNNMSAIKKRTFRKLKMQCAMSGGNLVHVTQLDSISALYLVIVSRAAEMAGQGIAYTTSALNADEFRNKLKAKTSFTCVERIEMSTQDNEFTKHQFDSVFKLSYVISESGLLYAIGKLNDVSASQFRVTGFTDKYFILMCKVKSTTYNYIINF
ncbi:hypothetical protein [Spirosoma foliorum]|uniref:Uncharacterized protein n=1 Tax=Spirosoma foliorum TaxID=2710596 RepID=A0A7G5GY88_9BACT|nr:hypothetical protein [Spirosoma foliorum]QMW03830.1 hypothetical protein H3H32_02400 [Spirosoma foliorum]